MDLQKMVVGYMTCALWSSTGDNDRPLDDDYSIHDISDEAKESMEADCKAFLEANEATLLETEHNEGRWTQEEQWGHDLWLTRNGHGTGFWDRGHKEEIGEELTKKANEMGTSDIYVGDDGELYLL